MSNIRENIKTELNKVKEMNKEQKWDYFKTYYLKISVISIICLILLIWFIKDTVFQKEIINAGCVYGVEITEEEQQILTDGYLKYLGLNPKKYDAFISIDNMFEGTVQQMDANTHEMALLAQIAGGQIYYMILDKDNLYMYENSGIYSSLDDLFPDGLPDRLNDGIEELTDPETGNSYPVAIDLSKAGLFNDGREAYLAFTIGIPNKEYPKKFLEYLLSL